MHKFTLKCWLFFLYSYQTILILCFGQFAFCIHNGHNRVKVNTDPLLRGVVAQGVRDIIESESTNQCYGRNYPQVNSVITKALPFNNPLFSNVSQV